MAGSVLFIALVVVGAILAFTVTPFIGIPLALIGLTALFAVPLLSKARGTSIAQSDGGPAGSTTTRDASYDPTR